jgi:putative ABC transport system permease protein
MLRTRTIKIWRDITASKRRTLLVSLSIGIGVLGVVAMITLGELISRQLERDLRPSEMAMLRVFVDVPPGLQIDNTRVLAQLRALPEIVRVEGEAVYEFHWRLPGEANFRTGELYAYSERFEDIQLEPVQLLRGRYPQEERGEIAIEQRLARLYGLNVGDRLEVQTSGGTVETVVIVGVLFQPYLYIGGGDGSTSAYMAYADAQHIVGFGGFSSFYVRYKDIYTTRQESAGFRSTIQDQTPYRLVFYVRTDPAQNPFLVSVQQLTRVLTALALVVLVVACLLVANIISVITTEQRQQIGALKAMGASRVDIMRIYLGLALVYGLLGTLPGVLLGVPLGQLAAEHSAPMANTALQDTTPPPEAIVIGMVLGVMMPLLAALIPVWNASRVSIRVAMSDPGIEANYGRGLLPVLVRWAHLPVPLVQVVNNIFRHKARLMLTFAALVAAAGAFMSMIAVVDTLSGVLDFVTDRLGRKVTADLGSIDLTDLRQTLFMDQTTLDITPGVGIELGVVQKQDAVPALEEVLEDPVLGVGAQENRLVVTAIDTTQDLSPILLLEGVGWRDDPERPGIVLAAGVAEIYSVVVGDTLTLQSPNHLQTFDIIGIADFPLEVGFMEWQQLRDLVGDIREAPTPNTYWEQVHLEIDTDDPRIEDNSVWAVGIDEQVGRYLMPGYDPNVPGVIASRAVAEAGGWEVGDLLPLAPPEGSLENLLKFSNETFPLLAIVDVTPEQLALVSGMIPETLRTDDPAVIAMPWWALADLMDLDYDKIVPETFAIDLLDPALNSTNDAPRPVFRNQSSFSDRVAQTMVGINGVMSLTSLLMAAVGGIGLLTVMSVNVLERQREIGVMRSVGATSQAIAGQLLLEGLLIGLAAWGGGLPLSYLLSRILIALMPFSDVISFHYTWLAPVIGLAGMMLVTTLATLYPASLASRKTVSEILRYK